MAVLLFSIGTFALVAGLVMVGFGIPINEFSFGNTLISAGTTAAVGGLIIIALGVAVGQLRRIAEMLAGDMPARYAQPMDLVEATGASSPAVGIPDRIPFPPRPKSEAPLARMGSLPGAPTNSGNDDGYDQVAAPTLPNPEEAPMAEEDEITLSSPQPSGGSVPKTDVKGLAGRGRQEPATSWKPSPASTPPVGSPPRPLQPARFDAMWPAEAKSPKSSVSDDAKPSFASASDTFPPERPEPEAQKSRAVAILKSGVVDGMGYTLYVDGSIEAELPQGTLRFASIKELRSHLEKNS
ncbi:MAG TPA: hypothetical protein VFN63_10010 [Pseudolabrys sp.]|nr:hypothetical protein [Pseudolabrys sp.]